MKFRWLFLILITYLVLGGLYAWFTPPWQAPDEPAHYNFARYVAEYGALPELRAGCYDEAYLNRIKAAKFAGGLSIEPICYENYQPPLYYLLAAPLFAATGGNLLALRLFSVALGGLSLIFMYATVALFWPKSPLPAATVAFAAFVPMHLTMMASVNNDSLAELLLAVFVYLLLRWLKTDPAGRPALLWQAGGALGLILLTKVTVYPAVALGAGVLLLPAAERRRPARLKNILRLYLPAALLSFPMYLRNALLYGGFDILGLRRHNAVVVGQLRSAAKLAADGPTAYAADMLRTTFHSFWGQFGWMAVPMDRRVYLALFILQSLALAGLGLWLWRREPLSLLQRRALWTLAGLFALVSGVFAGLNLSFVQFQGRYFFSALLPIGLFLSLGWLEIFRRRYALRVFAGLSMLTLWLGIASAWRGNPDKWGLLIGGAFAMLFLLRYRLPEKVSMWLPAAALSLLAVLSAVSVWWFIVPNL